ncbi:hypothetical protein M493_06675 [Geobacillus genomosp. 3]|uniref:Uncharacterized protein n=1 Tax=Geobacillus genomosp. 3 TaxID=1921421 RepID=S5Z3R1_GEOG3|nr:hypothetical protein M493_06675 [Geobacillus genomosp. 3]
MPTVHMLREKRRLLDEASFSMPAGLRPAPFLLFRRLERLFQFECVNGRFFE